MPDSVPILLQTKLHRPRLPRDLVSREHLIERLNREAERPLTLVCAPAGFGKTTLIGSWLERMDSDPGKLEVTFPSAWLSLDENDSDLTVFMRYFIAALRSVIPEACAQTMALLQARQLPPPALLHTTFSNDLAQLPTECILVLDDYQTIQGTEVHDLLGDLVRHWPDPLHLVLLSRISPPIPLGGLRAKGLLTEVRSRDLRFTPEETAAYLRLSHAPLSQKALPLLEERFEGWPAGLHLAALSLRSKDSQEAVLEALSREDANITGYLVDEVLGHQLPAIRTFLLRTSIMDRFCAPLCEAVVGGTDLAWSAQACLEWIERSGLFIVSLDDQGLWYRYHHLFQQLLQQHLYAEAPVDQVSQLHRQASVWFEKHQLLDEALQHALAAGDMDLACRQIGAGLCAVLNREDRATLERWLRMMPEEVVQRRADLLMLRAWALQFAWRLGPQVQVVQRAEELLDSAEATPLPESDRQILRAQISLIRAEQAFFSNQHQQAMDLSRQVLGLLPRAWSFVRGGAMMYLAVSMQASGRATEAEELFLREYEAHSDRSDTFALFILQSLSFVYLNAGRLDRARQSAQLLAENSSRAGMALMGSWGDWHLGTVGYLRNELESAARHFSQIVDNRYVAHTSPYRDSVAGLALMHQSKGDSASAWQLVESISQYDLELGGSEDPRTRSLRARLMLLDGDLDGAGDWADSLTGPPADQPLMWLEEPQLTRARVLVARHLARDPAQTWQVLDSLKEIVERTHNTRHAIELLALRALALEAQGESDGADAELRQSIDLARPGGFVRPFIDLGQPMQTLLRRIANQGHAAEAVRRLLAAFPSQPPRPVAAASPASPGPHSAGNLALAEPLTARELEVLSLLRGPLSLKEIALQLRISPATAKRHSINIYAKLGVSTRWKAVASAEELGLLPAL
jgi:LuxR family maltose regulon positive regulatory protein